MWCMPAQDTRIDVITQAWNILCDAPKNRVEKSRLVKQVLKFCSADLNVSDIEKQLSVAKAEGLLQETSTPTRRSSNNSKPAFTQWYTLPAWQEHTFFADLHDRWCYECHTSKQENMIKCCSCLRSFHSHCVKSFLEKQLELERFVSDKRITFSSYGASDSRSASRQSVQSPVTTVTTERESTTSTMDGSESPTVEPNLGESVAEPEDTEDGEKFRTTAGTSPQLNSVKQEDSMETIPILLADGAQFVGVVRSPDRLLSQRLNQPPVKPEDDGPMELSDNEDMMMISCFPCRLLQNPSKLKTSKEELNYLLNFVVKSHESWLPEDTFSKNKLAKSHKPPLHPTTIEICKKMILSLPKSLADIHETIAQQRYTMIEQFLVDLRDIVHNMGIIYGALSVEYDAALYLLANCQYDTDELRRCTDCFRHSNEKIEPHWFARPCTYRHEVVFAKQKSFQYWPAKVLLVTNDKYDVRFFGKPHSRALLQSQFVKPIDSDQAMLKINPKRPGFKQAMQELHMYLALQDGPRQSFAFGTTSSRIAAIENTPEVASPSVPVAPGRSTPVRGRASKRRLSPPLTGNLRGAKKTANGPLVHVDNPAATPANRYEEPMHTQNQSSFVDNNNITDTVSQSPLGSNAPIRLPRTKQNLRMQQRNTDWVKEKLDNAHDLETAKNVAIKLITDMRSKMTERDQQLRAEIEELKKRCAEAKSKRWCSVCNEEAFLECCWTTAYCSLDCKQRHWAEHRSAHSQQPTTRVRLQPSK
ncbi:zinc finger MYND domain-containing protein 11 [Anopheles aquasalis]|uniref:zinc finger MYND domain-containing protein 11 n=1 Tax=Anopheles aquasalis TaxID=42839 RepID=UPI00215A2F37|nr:zinc finger MYND domain-containing protein 11 [Anopheles aquasalis]